PEMWLYATSLRSPFSRTPNAPESSYPPGVFTDILLLFWKVLPTITLSEAPSLTSTPATLPARTLSWTRFDDAPAGILTPDQQSCICICATTIPEPKSAMQSFAAWITGGGPLP